MIDQEVLSRLTLVVPTFNRQKFALRLMKYWDERGPIIIVLDGTAVPISSDLLSEFGPRVRYFHHPAGIYTRLSGCLELIETDFVIFAGDDEFYIPSALEQCINELDLDPNLVACSGRAVGFTPTKSKIIGRPIYEKLAGYEIDSDVPFERLSSHMQKYVPCQVCAVCRSDIWKDIWRHVLAKEFSFFSAGELQFEMCLSYTGRSKVISEVMWLRSIEENAPVRGTDVCLIEKHKFSNWWSSGGDEKYQFIDSMAYYFSKVSLVSISNAKDELVNAVELYIDYCNRKTKNERGSVKTINFLRNLFHRLFIYFARSEVCMNYRYFNSPSLVDFCKNMAVSEVAADVHEVERISFIIENFHRNKFVN